LKITGIKATTVTVPLEAPLRHANGCHWGRFVRTIVQVFTDEGITGLGEMGGGGESAELAFKGLEQYLLGHDPLFIEAMRWKIMNPTASLYNNRTQLHAALEFACLDIAGKKLGVSCSELLGGRLRDRVPFAAYLFYRYRNEQTGAGGESTAAEIVAHARQLQAAHGFRTFKLKGGVFHPDHDIEVMHAPSFRRFRCGSTRTGSGRLRNPFVSAVLLNRSGTIIWKTPAGGWKECGGYASGFGFLPRPTRSW
jgi:glucarate dehydratase